MIKAVIADDEERICRLIQALVDWDALGIEVCGTAANGIEALDRLREKKPDILITDIRMPGCNGLELIERARELCPELFIIVISGYAQFEYAKTAIQHGVSEYLLKPINKKELTDSLEKIKTRIHERRKKEEDSKNRLETDENDRNRLRSTLIRDLLDNSSMQPTEEILKKQYHLNVSAGNYQAFCVKLDEEAGARERRSDEILWEKIEKIFDSSLKKYCKEWVLMQKRSCLYGVVNYTPKETEEIRRALRDCINQLEGQKILLGSVAFTLGLGIVVKLPEELGKSMETARRAVQERLVSGTGKLLEIDGTGPILYEQKLLDKYARKLSHALELLSMEELEAAVYGLQQSVLETPNARGWEIFELVQSAGSMFAMQLDMKDKGSFLEQLKESCENCKSSEELFETLAEFEREQMENILELREKDQTRPIRLAKQYIQNHYNEPITLEEVSEEVGLSPAYFSVLFKKETEVGFAKYLIQVRMEETKVLLRETNLPVAEICRKVGYNDIKHFTHTFEKITGIKPAVYRKLYG